MFLDQFYILDISVRVVNAGLYFIFLSNLFLVSFYFLSLFYLGLGWSVMSYVTGWSHHVTVTRSCDEEKVLEGSRIDNIMQYDKNILVL